MSSLTLKQLVCALQYISPDCHRADWWKILAAAKAGFGDNVYSEVCQWSQQSDKFKQRDFDSTWRSLNGSGVGIGTLLYEAKQGGWSRNSDSQPPPKILVRKAPKPLSSTADYALRIWSQVERDDEVVAGHPYAVKKGIDWACGAGRGVASGSQIGRRVDCIVAPMRDDSGVIGVECINGDGVKQTFGKKGILTLGNTLDDSLPIYVVEGWADAASTWRLMDNVVVIAAFGIAMMERVKESMPTRNVTIVEDAK